MSHDQESLLIAIHDLVTRVLDGTADTTDRTRLETLVAQSPQARRLYVAYMQDTAVLKWQSDTPTTGVLRDLADDMEMRCAAVGGRWRSSLMTWIPVGLAIAAMIGLTSVLTMTMPRKPDTVRDASDAVAAPTQSPVAPSSPSPAIHAGTKLGVATLMRITDVAWSRPAEARHELTRLAAGEVLRFDRGEMEVVFDAGVEVLLRGPAEFEIRATDYAVATLGVISARVGEDGRGFTIETPTARVVDLGTEFGIDVADSGATEVAVFRGLVDLAVSHDRSGAGNTPRRLRQGEALRVAPDGSLNRVMAISSDRFPATAVRRLSEVPPMRVIDSVHDTGGESGSRKFYRIVRSGLHEDAQAFVDRNHQWNGVTSDGIPEFLRGIEYVMPYNDDKFADHLHVSIDLAQPATLYVLYSDSLPVPEWLIRDFVDTGCDIGLDEAKNRFVPTRQTDVGPGRSVDTVFSVWKRNVPEPTTITLGAVQVPVGREGYNMYGIAAAPLQP